MGLESLTLGVILSVSAPSWDSQCYPQCLSFILRFSVLSQRLNSILSFSVLSSVSQLHPEFLSVSLTSATQLVSTCETRYYPQSQSKFSVFRRYQYSWHQSCMFNGMVSEFITLNPQPFFPLKIKLFLYTVNRTENRCVALWFILWSLNKDTGLSSTQ